MTKAAPTKTKTRDRLLATARYMFSERGFYGTSIADIAAAQSVSKQALLHHFQSKAKLYGEILGEIATELENLLAEACRTKGSETDRLIQLFTSLIPENEREQERLRLLLREMLDVRRRSENAGKWYLSDFVTGLENQMRRVAGWQHADASEVCALLCQWIGAVFYTEAARVTHRGIHGELAEKSVWGEVPRRLDRSIRVVLKQGPTTKD